MAPQSTRWDAFSKTAKARTRWFATITFIAPVANVDSTILKLPLKEGFRFTGLSEQKARNLLAHLEQTTPWTASKQFLLGHPYFNMEEKVVYFIENSIPVEPLKEGQDWWSTYFKELVTFENQKVLGYLLPTLRKLKLFSRGNIGVANWYYYEIENLTPKLYMGHTGGGPTMGHGRLHLEESDLKPAIRFLDRVQMPLPIPYLKLAFENFELSYQAPSNGLSFLTLMICLETLFNPGEGEVRHRIARNVAVALGETTEQSEELYARIKRYYHVRSKMVHSGKTDSLKRDDVPELRELCRVALKGLVEAGMDKGVLMADLNKRSFGSPITPRNP